MNLTIEKMIYGGDGLGRSPEGKAVFVPLVLPGEEVDAIVREEKPGYMRAEARMLVRTSAKRIDPLCPYFARCGGCHYQHTDYRSQLEFKRDILRETLRRTAKLEWTGDITVHSGEPWGYRNRSRFKVRPGPAFALGYHRRASNDLMPVESCPISSPAINRAMARLWELGRAGRVPEGIDEVEIFADHDDSALLIEAHARNPLKNAQPFADELLAGNSWIRGVAILVSAEPQVVKTFGQPSLDYRVGGESFRVSAGSFFQTNRCLIEELACTVVADAAGALALDLYAGAGLFARPLAKTFERVIAVEAAAASAGDLQVNVPRNVSAVRATTQDFLTNSKDFHPDLVVVDPPRAGLAERVTRPLTALGAQQITYVSCDPTTMARDLNSLSKSGYRLEEVHLFDLFPQTFHLESVVKLGR